MTIRILHIHTLPVISGSGINTFLTMQGLDKSVYHVDLACAPGGPLIDHVRRHGMSVHTIPNLVQPIKPVDDILALIHLTRFLRKNPYHIVHTHNSKAGFIGRLASKSAGVPVIVHTVHGFAFHPQEPFRRRMLFRALERLAARWCDRMIFISQPLQKWSIREKIGRPEKMSRIYSGIQLDRFKPMSKAAEIHARARWGMSREDAVIGIVSKLWEGKGHRELLRVVKGLKDRMPNVKLMIVGEGYLRRALMEQVRDLDLVDSVIFTGFLMDVSEAIGAMDVAVLPSYFEGMGRVILEAMAMEKPVVGTRVGGIPDLIREDENGFLVSPGRVPELEQAIGRILEDRTLAERLGKAGRRRVTDTFSAETMVRSIERVYRECMDRKGVRVEH
jgi:glycosyltransferase involved in cell wall biosynthesis